jgi:hypothetical protein
MLRLGPGIGAQVFVMGVVVEALRKSARALVTTELEVTHHA